MVGQYTIVMFKKKKEDGDQPILDWMKYKRVAEIMRKGTKDPVRISTSCYPTMGRQKSIGTMWMIIACWLLRKRMINPCLISSIWKMHGSVPPLCSILLRLVLKNTRGLTKLQARPLYPVLKEANG